jgi:hypothetical protein
MSDELESVWNKATLVYLKILSGHSPGAIEENMRKRQSMRVDCWPRFKLDTSRIRIRSITVWAKMVVIPCRALVLHANVELRTQRILKYLQKKEFSCLCLL